jgi:putative membrane protein
MRAGLIAAALVGLLLATGLIAYFGAAEVGAAIASAGWLGLAVVCAVHLAPLLLCAAAWRPLIPGPRPSLRRCLAGRWVRDGVGNLIGLLPVTGELAGARYISLSGVGMLESSASVVVDLTVESVSQALFTIIGLAILCIRLSLQQAEPWLFVGFAATLPIAAVPLVARSPRALRLVESLADRIAASFNVPRRENGETLAEIVRAIFRRRRAIAQSFLLHLLAWIGAAAETWALLSLSKRSLGFADAVALESLVFALRGAIFIVPTSIGVQEGGYVLVGALFGLNPEAALALSLLKRVRDLVFGVPALVAWQAAEGAQLYRQSSRAA